MTVLGAAVAILLMVGGGRATGQTSPESNWLDRHVADLKARVSLVGTSTTGERLPFWLVSNRYGTLDRGGENGLVRMRTALPISPGRTFDAGATIDVAARAAKTSTVYLHEAYMHLVGGPLHLTVGRRERVQGIIDTTMSIGGTTWSRNATPVPAVRIEAPSYVRIPGTKGFAAAKGMIGHGWLEEDRYVRQPYLHQKQFYLRVFPEEWPLQLHGGVIHNVVWAGTLPNGQQLPDGWEAFQEAALGMRLGETTDSSPEGGSSGRGNSIAAYDFAITAQTDGFEGTVYREFYIDTAAGRRFRNPWDGLWGVSLQRTGGPHVVDGLLYEHLRFVRHNAIWGEPGRTGSRGREIYYNNFLYESGWTYEGRVIGTPLALTTLDAPGLQRQSDTPERDPNFPVVNNIIVANHIGVTGQIEGWRYKTLLTYSRNHGTYFRPQSRLDQFSMLFEAHGPLWTRYNLSGRIGIAGDIGKVFDKRIGLMVGLAWEQ